MHQLVSSIQETGKDSDLEISEKDKEAKERIALLVSSEEKQEWQDFAENKLECTLSKLIRNAVEFYITLYTNNPEFESFSKISHDLKEPLTAIMGYVHLLIEKNKDELSAEILSILREILDKCNVLDAKIGANLETDRQKSQNPVIDILVVDDDTATIKILQSYFELRGIRCKGITSGLKVQDEIRMGHPAAILLDIILPEKSGYDICREIKNDELTKDIAVYYISAIPGYEIEKLIETTGANGYFSKPFNFNQIEELIKSLKSDGPSGQEFAPSLENNE